MSVWRILSFLSVRLDKIRRRWKKWLGYSRWKTKRLGIPATKIQAVVWMAGVKHTVLHYYKFRRGLIALQGVRPAVHRTRDLTLTLTLSLTLLRRFPCMRRFAYDIYYYRAAVRIQRLM